MNIISYLRDKIFYLFFNIVSMLIIAFLLILFDSNEAEIIYIITILLICNTFPLVYEYIKKKIFYKSFKETLEKLDRKYLITEMITSSNFLDGKILLDYLYDIDKSYHEEINDYKYLSNELKEYIELWCHEIKTPIATSKLIIDNNNNEITRSILEELDHIENYIEQVLFYSRSETLEKDYLISSVNLKNVIDNVIKRNKKDLIGKKIKIVINNLYDVKSDSKWLEFIINQIMINSIKYSKDKNKVIKIGSVVNKNNTVLTIEDNGIGIKETELDKVFDKGFTGINGRSKYNSTGIGLYLCKKLCIKLGHDIKIESKLNEYTKVSITFPNNSYIEEIK